MWNLPLLNHQLTELFETWSKFEILLATNVTTMEIVISNYSSTLTNMSSVFFRDSAGSPYYCEAIYLTVPTSGIYTFISVSNVDADGYLYVNQFDLSNLTANLIALNDDHAGNRQFRITYPLQAGVTYILVFSTFDPELTGPFSIVASGYGRVNFDPSMTTTTAPLTAEPSSVGAIMNESRTRIGE